MPVRKFDSFRWHGVDLREYKADDGSHKGVTRQTLAQPDNCKFQTRYFELQPGGYTSYEQHRHEHVVVVVRGHGEVFVGDIPEPIAPFDVVEIEPMTPHQFLNTGAEPLGFLCIVDKERDKPELLRRTDTAAVAERPRD